MKVGIILGTRPEIIKMSPIIKRLENKKINHFVLHTGQHYDFSMDKIFFEELGLNPAITNLNVGSGTHGEVTGKSIIGIEKFLQEKKPDVVLVEGDTNTVLAGALTSIKLNIPVGHVEAGLRSFDRRLPEEYNRIITDHVSDYLFAPTKLARKNLKDEGIGKNEIQYYNKKFTPQIFKTGNTIVDALLNNLDEARKKSKIMENHDLKKEDYFVVTAHRQENVDDKEKLIEIIKGLKLISENYDHKIIYPIHPRTKNRLQEFGLINEMNNIKNLKLIEPISFFDSLVLQSNSKLVLTDSGGIQEESCSLKIPGVILRNRTDRQEAVDVGASMLAGCDSNNILECTKLMLNKERNWENPYGDGKASEKIIKALQKFHI